MITKIIAHAVVTTVLSIGVWLIDDFAFGGHFNLINGGIELIVFVIQSLLVHVYVRRMGFTPPDGIIEGGM